MKKLVNGQYIEMTEDEMQAHKDAAVENPLPASPEERIAELEEALALLLSGVTE